MSVSHSSNHAAPTIVALLVIGAFAFTVSTAELPASGLNASVSYRTTWSATDFANSTYTFISRQSVTSDYFLSVVINVTCSACTYSGEYANSYSHSAPTHVSGTGSNVYSAGSFATPLSLSWVVSKNSSEGTLRVEVEGSAARNSPYYDSVTSAPYGTLSGSWSIAVLYGSEVSTTGTSAANGTPQAISPFLLVSILVAAGVILSLALWQASRRGRARTPEMRT